MSSINADNANHRTATFYEIHGETHGSVGGSFDRAEAETLAKQLDKAFDQCHFVVETERLVA